jgi:acetyl-CoA acetyltransferase
MATDRIGIGVGDTAVGKLPGRTPISLAVEAAAAAVRDAGLDMGQIDGVVTTQPMVGSMSRQALTLAEALGICHQITYCDTVRLGGASALVGFARACRLVAAGRQSAILVVSADTPRTGQLRKASVAQLAELRHPAWEQPFGMSNVSAYALVAQHYLDRYQLGPDALAVIPVELRRHAETHPGAVYRDPLTIDQVTASRMVASPFHLLECSPVSDGAAAAVIFRPDFGSDHPFISLLGSAEGYRYDNISFAGDLGSTGAALSSARALGEASVAVSDVDVALLYDPYSVTLAIELEEIGFCAPGQAPDFVAAGGIRVDGQIPANTHGGLLSHSHCGSAAGIHHIVEAIRQLHGTASNQVASAEIALLHAEGGILSANCTVLLAAS